MAEGLAQRAQQQSGMHHVAGLRRENAQLLRSMHELRLENQALKSHLYRVSALLDCATSKLDSLGVALVLPQLDIRAINREAKEAAETWNEMTAGADEAKEETQRRFVMQAELKDHTKAVHCAAFCPGDQELIASAGADRRLVLHSFATGMKVTSIDQAHAAGITDLAWLSQSTVVTVSADATSKTWDVSASGKTTSGSSSSSTSTVSLAAASPCEALHTFTVKDGFFLSAAVIDVNTYVCSDSRRSTYLVDTRVKRGPPPGSWEHPARISSLACETGAAPRVITGSTTGIVAVWDLRMLNQQLPIIAAAAAAAAAVVGVPSASPSDGLPESPKATTPSTVATRGGEGLFPAVAPAVQFENEVSRTPIIHLSCYRGRDDVRRLLVISDDDMIRLYKTAAAAGSSTLSGGGGGSPGSSDASSSIVPGGKKEFVLGNLLPGVQTRSFNVRAAFWQGKHRRQAPQGFDDGDQRGEPSRLFQLRKLNDCDLVVSGGGGNYASVFDVTDDGLPVVLQRLEGHKDRVTGATVHHNDSRPLVATFSADTTLRIWVPAKSER
jgi:WD40 repeat protein